MKPIVSGFVLTFVLTATAIGNGWKGGCLENCGSPTYWIYTSDGETFSNAPERIPFVGLSLQPGLRPEDFARLKAVARRVASLPGDPSTAFYAINRGMLANTPDVVQPEGHFTPPGGARRVEHGSLMNMAEQTHELPDDPTLELYPSNGRSFGKTSDRVPFVGLSLQPGLRPEDFQRLKAVARRVAPLPHYR